MRNVLVAVVLVAVAIIVYFMVTRPCRSRIHGHRHLRFRPHHR